MKDNKNIEDKKNNFSISLGLFDYINPILYLITTSTIIKNMYTKVDVFSFILLLLGALLSLIFGLMIPTVKLLVGMGKMKFKMPVNLVFYVNLGIFILGITLLKNVFKLKLYLIIILLAIILFLLYLIFKKNKKFNTIAVLLGSFGYIFIYSSLICLSIRNNSFITILLYLIAIILFIFLCMIGIKANLKDARVHWVIEISNVLCQLLVAVSTIILFSKGVIL